MLLSPSKLLSMALLAIPALSLPTGTNSPTPTEDNVAMGYPSRLPVNTQSCISINNGIYNGYHVRIGLPFRPEVCSPLGNTFASSMVGFSGYHCRDDGWGDFDIWFTELINEAGTINGVLKDYFPTINNGAGFNCPNT